MCENPGNLQDYCLDYICDNISVLCQEQDEEACSQSKLVFKNSDIFLPSTFSDQLLYTFGKKQKLTDATLSLFDIKTTTLKRVKINSSPLTPHGMRVLKSHKIIELEASSLQNVSVNDLIGCLGEWTLSNLRVLDVNHGTFINSSGYCILVGLSKLKKLQFLNVSFTEFNDTALDIVSQDLPSLETLDISHTPICNLSPLRKCKNRLKSLSMFNLQSSHSSETVDVLCDLINLRHLDISEDYNPDTITINLQPNKFHINSLLQKTHCLPDLVSLDISGTHNVKSQLLRDFIEQHPKLRFIGLANTEVCYMDIFVDTEHRLYSSDLKVSGEALESQLLESLRRYPKRCSYMHRAMFNLFNLTQNEDDVTPRLDIIKLLLPVMKAHVSQVSVQMAATACLYNLTKQELGKYVHPIWLSRIVDQTMDAMENFPNHKQLQKNALLTLCSDRILQDVTFDRYRCVTLAMECLCTFEDTAMTRMSVAVCGILAAKIPTNQTSQLGAKSKYMKTMLEIVAAKMETDEVDLTMRFTLSALWNLTDESPSTCTMFVHEGGLELFLKVLKKYQTLSEESRHQVETKVLGLINNVAEVKNLRPMFLKEDVMKTIRDKLDSPHTDVSYFSAGILSHLLSDTDCSWENMAATKQELLSHLETAVLQWKEPNSEMVAYRSFYPFFPLLRRYDLPQVQLWSVWAMNHVCEKHGARYCPMLVDEGVAEILLELVASQQIKPEVAKLSNKVLKIIDEKQGPHWRQKGQEVQ